jgi:hypothetical protein
MHLGHPTEVCIHRGSLPEKDAAIGSQQLALLITIPSCSTTYLTSVLFLVRLAILIDPININKNTTIILLSPPSLQSSYNLPALS